MTQKTHKTICLNMYILFIDMWNIDIIKYETILIIKSAIMNQ